MHFLSTIVCHVSVSIHSSFLFVLYRRSFFHLVEAGNVHVLLFLQYMEANLQQFQFEGYSFSELFSLSVSNRD